MSVIFRRFYDKTPTQNLHTNATKRNLLHSIDPSSSVSSTAVSPTSLLSHPHSHIQTNLPLASIHLQHQLPHPYSPNHPLLSSKFPAPMPYSLPDQHCSPPLHIEAPPSPPLYSIPLQHEPLAPVALSLSHSYTAPATNSLHTLNNSNNEPPSSSPPALRNIKVSENESKLTAPNPSIITNHYSLRNVESNRADRVTISLLPNINKVHSESSPSKNISTELMTADRVAMSISSAPTQIAAVSQEDEKEFDLSDEQNSLLDIMNNRKTIYFTGRLCEKKKKK